MTYSIDWPPGFVSRTSMPGDPCFVGRINGEKNAGNQPAAQPWKPSSLGKAAPIGWFPKEKRKKK